MRRVHQHAVEGAGRSGVQEQRAGADPLPRLAVAVADQLAAVAVAGVAPALQESQVQVAVVERRDAAMPLVRVAEAGVGLVEHRHLGRVGPVHQVGTGAQRRVAAEQVEGALVQPPAAVALVAGDHHVVAVPHRQQPPGPARPVHPVRAGVQVLAPDRPRLLHLLRGDVRVLLRVGRRPHAVVLHVGDQLVAAVGIGVVLVADHGEAVHVVEHADHVAVLVRGRQPLAAARQLELDQVVAVGREGVPEVVGGAAAVAHHAQVGLGPVAAVHALGQRVAAAVQLARLARGVHREVPHAQAVAGLADHAPPRLRAVTLPRPVGAQHRLRKPRWLVHHPDQVHVVLDLGVVDEQVQVGIIHRRAA